MGKDQIKRWQNRIGQIPDGDFGPATLRDSLALADRLDQLEAQQQVPPGAPSPSPGPVITPGPENPYSVYGHWLCLNGVQVATKLSPNHGGVILPELIVIHYTGDNSLHGALEWLCDPGAKVSAHLVIDKTGKVWQFMPFNVRAWHAGVSKYEQRPDVNSFSIGIENVGKGDEWPDVQIEANRLIIACLLEHYPAITDVVGHSQVAQPAGRKVDPGPNYPWEKVLPI